MKYTVWIKDAEGESHAIKSGLSKEAADRLVKEFDGIAPAVAKQEGI